MRYLPDAFACRQLICAMTHTDKRLFYDTVTVCRILITARRVALGGRSGPRIRPPSQRFRHCSFEAEFGRNSRCAGAAKFRIGPRRHQCGKLSLQKTVSYERHLKTNTEPDVYWPVVRRAYQSF